MKQTIDDASYYRRTKTVKHGFVYDYVKENDDINFVYDVGCNNANISYPLQRDLEKKVLGVDLSERLNIPNDYDFKIVDIVTSNDVVMNDCTLFMSLYHHILGNNGIDVADDVFYKLLLRTKHLIFDTGNLSERKRSGKPRMYSWYHVQKKYFKTEDDLLNHFGVNYDVIGEWTVGGGRRSVVAFKKDSIDRSFEILGKYKRKNGSRYAAQGLFDFDKKISHEWDRTVFHKLKLGNKTFFAKKHVLGRSRTSLENRNETELFNTVYANKHIDPAKLIKFYGWSDRFGLIFEWVDNMVYLRRTEYKIGERLYKDVDLVDVDGKEKIIDFHY